MELKASSKRMRKCCSFWSTPLNRYIRDSVQLGGQHVIPLSSPHPMPNPSHIPMIISGQLLIQVSSTATANICHIAPSRARYQGPRATSPNRPRADIRRGGTLLHRRTSLSKVFSAWSKIRVEVALFDLVCTDSAMIRGMHVCARSSLKPSDAKNQRHEVLRGGCEV